MCQPIPAVYNNVHPCCNHVIGETPPLVPSTMLKQLNIIIDQFPNNTSHRGLENLLKRLSVSILCLVAVQVPLIFASVLKSEAKRRIYANFHLHLVLRIYCFFFSGTDTWYFFLATPTGSGSFYSDYRYYTGFIINYLCQTY